MADGKLTDARCWDVYREVDELDQATPSKVAENLDSSMQALRRYFKLLESIDAVTFRKSGRSKIYKVSNFRSGLHRKFRKFHKYKRELEEEA